ncbi:MAG: sulfatase [Aureliella sp.]
MARNILHFIALLLAAGSCFGGRAHAAEQLNILLITADDLGPQLSCYGDTVANTPNIDALSAQAVQFTTAYVSQASCSPSRSTMFTGLYPHGNGHYGLANANVGFALHSELYPRLLPNVLKRSGYRTGIIGKLHVNPEKEFLFDYRENDGFGSREVDKQVQYASDFINGANDAPWFLMLNMFDPHVARKRMAGGQRGPQYFPDKVAGLPETVLTSRDVPPWPWQQIDNERQLEKIAGYYNCVHRIDHAIGLLTQMLHKTGHWDDTLIIFLGDHGPPFARGKTSCYEAGLRVPFIARWPGVSRPHVSGRLVSSIDIYPTILDAAGVEPTTPVHGESLRRVLSRGADGEWRRTLAAEFHLHGASPFFPRRAITDGRFKLIHNIRAGELSASPSVDGDQAYVFAEKLPADHPGRRALERMANPPEWEFYDLRNDPHELAELSSNPSMSRHVQELKTALFEWQKATEDPFVDPAFRERVEKKYRK